MEGFYDCFEENGLHGIGIRVLGEYCGGSSRKIYLYFENLDNLIIQSIEYCMRKVEDEFIYGESPHGCRRSVAVYRRDTILDGRKTLYGDSQIQPGWIFL